MIVNVYEMSPNIDPLSVITGAGDPLASRELAAATTQILASRKRKAWEGIHEVANSKWTGGQRPPALRYQWLVVSSSLGRSLF